MLPPPLSRVQTLCFDILSEFLKHLSEAPIAEVTETKKVIRKVWSVIGGRFGTSGREILFSREHGIDLVRAVLRERRDPDVWGSLFVPERLFALSVLQMLAIPEEAVSRPTY